jgi:fucose permease
MSAGLQDAGSNILSVRFPIVGDLVLNYFHAIYGIGALVGPPIATAIIVANLPWNYVYFVWLGFQALNVFLVVVSFRLMSTKGKDDVVLGKTAVVDETVDLTGQTLELGGMDKTVDLKSTQLNETVLSRAETTKAAASTFKEAMKIPLIWIAAFYLLFYVGAEVVVGSWAFSFLTVVRGGTTAESGPFVSVYWAGLVVSRLFFMPLTAKLGDFWAGEIYTFATIVALAIMWAVSNIQVNAGMLFIIGLGFGPLYPLTISIVSQAFDQKDLNEQAIFATGMGFLVALGSAGAAFFPWFTGFVSEYAGTDGSGIWVFLPITIGLSVILVVLYAAMVWIVRKRAKERQENKESVDREASVETMVVAT